MPQNELTQDFSTDPFIIFLHIHKCAGMTFQRELLRLFGKPVLARAWNYFLKKGDADLTQSMKAMAMKDRYFSGHLSFGIHESLPSPATYITFLRDPVNRLVSLYNYSASQPHAYYHKLASRLTFHEFLLTGKGPLEADNGMTRFLAGGGTRHFIGGSKFGEVDESLFNQAVSNIESSFSYIGITELYDLSHVVFYRLLGQEPRPYFMLNKSKLNPLSRALPSASDLAGIRELNKWDYKLYEYGVEFLKNQAVGRFGISDAEVRAFTERNRQFNERWGSMQNAMESIKERVKSL